MEKLKWHKPEELKDFRDDVNIVFLDQERWLFHEAAFRGWKDDGMPVYVCDGKYIDTKDIFLWCTRHDMLQMTDFAQLMEQMIKL